MAFALLEINISAATMASLHEWRLRIQFRFWLAKKDSASEVTAAALGMPASEGEAPPVVDRRSVFIEATTVVIVEEMDDDATLDPPR